MAVSAVFYKVTTFHGTQLVPVFNNSKVEEFMVGWGFTKSMEYAITLGYWQNAAKVFWNPNIVDVRLLQHIDRDSMVVEVSRVNYRELVMVVEREERVDCVFASIRKNLV
ncbi:hypothetical protein ACH5RR_007130 [Cinchona calisaya]|uniref:Uncharacterized protein n=1 Tax=Cinchona calisaya TaxID=153742 RepID=A0ABD3AQW4_9GENT